MLLRGVGTLRYSFRCNASAAILRGVGTLRYSSPPKASAQWQPGDLRIRAKKWFVGAGFLGAPPISLTQEASWLQGSRKGVSKNGGDSIGASFREVRDVAFQDVGLENESLPTLKN